MKEQPARETYARKTDPFYVAQCLLQLFMLDDSAANGIACTVRGLHHIGMNDHDGL